MRRAAAALCVLLIFTACSEPPHKEIERAQGAIDAARAAGAEQYAAEPFTAATTAMRETHDAVEQRDYRLALSRAIDANDRALEAARQAADGKARARSEAEAAATRLATTLGHLDDRLEAATTGKLTAKETEPARRTRADADRALQEARAAMAKEDYRGAVAIAKGVPEKILEQLRELDTAVDARTARTPRRRR
jgi:hypothetical protein